MIRANPDAQGHTTKGNDLQEHVMRNVMPREVAFKPAKIYNNKDEHVNIKAYDDNVKKMANSDMEEKFNIKISTLGKFKPTITIFNVQSDIDGNNFAQEIITQNNIREDAVIIPQHRFGPGNKHFVHWVLETDPETRKKNI